MALFDEQALSQDEKETATANHAAARGSLRSAQSDLARKQLDLSRAELPACFQELSPHDPSSRFKQHQQAKRPSFCSPQMHWKLRCAFPKP